MACFVGEAPQSGVPRALKESDVETNPTWEEGGIWVRRSISEVDAKRIPQDVLERYGDAIIPLPNTTRILRIKHTETRRVRFVPLPADLLTRLREHIETQGTLISKLTATIMPTVGCSRNRPRPASCGPLQRSHRPSALFSIDVA